MKQYASQGNNLRLRDGGGSRGKSSTQNQKTQDSQHMLIQPRGSFPEAIPKKIASKDAQGSTILTQIMADEFNFSWWKIHNCIAEADADLIPVPRPIRITWWMQMWCLAVSMLWCSICCRSYCGDGGIRVTLQMQRQT